MTSTHGRKIAPFRMSGHNPRPTPPRAAQQPSLPREAPSRGTMRIGPQRPSPRMAAHLANVENVTAGPPPLVPKSGPTVAVFLDGEPVRIPLDWMLSFSSQNNRDVLYAIDTTNVLHVLVVDAGGELKALHGLTADLVDDIYRWRFPKVRQ